MLSIPPAAMNQGQARKRATHPLDVSGPPGLAEICGNAGKGLPEDALAIERIAIQEQLAGWPTSALRT
jgi:hypothetical protein